MATRQAISDAATRLIIEHGFDQVTVDDIAAAADVGRMTVFNHFPRKEDMFFDRDAEGRAMLRAALATRPAGMPPVETLRLFAHRLIAEGSPALAFSDRSRRFVETLLSSETLKARARAIRDETAADLALALADCAGREAGDPLARLAAGLLLAVWSVALAEAHTAYREAGDADAAQALFLDLVDRGSRGVAAALAGSGYT